VEQTQERLVINCDETPLIPYAGWKILPESEQLPNRVRGLLELDVTKLTLHLVDGQGGEGRIRGDLLREALRGLGKGKVLPANVLDALLEGGQHHIQEEWGGKDIFFWGTIYGDTGSKYVRCLQWNGDRWGDSYRWLGFDFREYSPALVLTDGAQS
jgi:hypothetical protein